MIEENQDFNLETDHLKEVIESPPPAQPVVVIQYRTRGVPWYLVLPLLVLVPLGAVAIYHRVSSHAHRTFVPPPSVDQSTRKAAESGRHGGALRGVNRRGSSRGAAPCLECGFWRSPGAQFAADRPRIVACRPVLPHAYAHGQGGSDEAGQPGSRHVGDDERGRTPEDRWKLRPSESRARCHGREHSTSRGDSCERAWASGCRHHSRGRDPPRPSRGRGGRLLGAGR